MMATLQRIRLRQETQRSSVPQARFRCELATGPRDILATQRLRYKVFSEEMGANLGGRIMRLDRDHYDKYCRHLLVRDLASNKIVACTRLLSEEDARRAGGFYSAGEFIMGPFTRLPGRVLEVGRTCVHPDFRSGAVIAVLWAKLAEYIFEEGFDYVLGCASIGIVGDGANVEAIMQKVRAKHMSPEFLRVEPREHMPPVKAAEYAGRMPPLLKAYFGLGAKACGEPYRDDDFGVADVFVLLDVNEMSPRYRRHFLRDGNAAKPQANGGLNVH